MSKDNQDVVFITGANTGLGLEIVKSLCRSTHSYQIILGCRSVSKGQAAVEEVKKQYASTTSAFSVVQIDLASDESIEKAVETIRSAHGGRLDVLVNNGGANFDTKIQNGEIGLREGFIASWDTNVAGTQVLTTLAVPLLLKSSNPRLIFMTSGTSTMTETESMETDVLKAINASPPAGWPKPPAHNPITAYRSSKAGLNMVMREWTRILGNDGVKVWCVSPGFLITGLNPFDRETLKKMGAIEPSVGADFAVSVIEGARDHDVGKAIRKSMIQPW